MFGFVNTGHEAEVAAASMLWIQHGIPAETDIRFG